jgi:ABC-type Mn2+/Zn2+ transport system permease subunit/Mn-dependent DtxR family transcriptional regulator
VKLLPKPFGFRCLLLASAISLVAFSPAYAAKVSDVSSTNLREQALRFFTFQDPSLRYALAGVILLGVTCGLLGSFIVVRKMALVGDTLSHAVLPGVALGFLWHQTKDPFAIFVGATIAGLVGTAIVGWIKQTTRLKEDAALGLVLASFFAIGICLVTMIQRLPTGNKSGIDKFLFGQAAALSAGDVRLIAVVAILSFAAITLFYKECLVGSFDPEFARTAGFPTRLIHQGVMLLLAFSIVIALQAVGVVLVSAMLITPAAAAYLLTDRMHIMLILAAIFGMVAGVLGAFFSFLGNNLPTGPFMVLGASAVFAAAFLFGPRHGVVVRWWKRMSRANRIRRENTLKSIYRVLEDRNFQGEGVSLRELAELRHESLEQARAQSQELRRDGFVTTHEDGNIVLLTPEGWQRACEIVRNHRLWELYLTNAAQYAADHVHEDADKIEHVLGMEIVRDLERRLQFAKRDPHGKLIPGLGDIYPRPARTGGRIPGYG